MYTFLPSGLTAIALAIRRDLRLTSVPHSGIEPMQLFGLASCDRDPSGPAASADEAGTAISAATTTPATVPAIRRNDGAPRPVISSRQPRYRLNLRLRRQIALPRVEDDRLVWTKSVTLTESVMSCVRVPSQRSATVHFVPRTVAALYLPLVLNLPLALACSNWGRSRRGLGHAGVAGLLLGAQRVGRRTLERALDDREHHEALAGAAGCLADLEDRATEVALLGDGLALLALLPLALGGQVGGRVGAAGGRRWSARACRGSR